MKFPCSQALALSLLFFPGWVTADEVSTEELLKQLGSETYAEREKASLELWKLGDRGLDVLKKAAEGSDPEVSKRAGELIHKIDLGILPDSSPTIISLVTAYDKAPPAERGRILGSLRRLKAWRQILKLYAMEKDESALPSLSNAVEGVPLLAAQECLATEPPRAEEAIAYLKMGRPGPAEWMAIASIHRSMGTLDAEAKDAEADKGPNGPIRRYAALAIAGKIHEAAAAAEAAGMKEASWRMHVLEGDPLPWITTAGTGEDDYPPDGLAEYREWVVQLWKTGLQDLKYAPRFSGLANSDDEDKANNGLTFMLLTNEREEAEKILKKSHAIEAFSYFESEERLDEAIAALGLDPVKPDYAGWVLPRFTAIIDKPDESEVEQRDLFYVANFMTEHGMGKDIEDAFRPGLEKLLDANPDQFLQLAPRFLGGKTEGGKGPMRTLVFELSAKLAKEDDARWQDVIQALFFHDASCSALWTWLGEMNPGMPRPQRLELLAKLINLIPTKREEIRPFLAPAIESYKKLNDADQAARLDALAQIAASTGDPKDYYDLIELTDEQKKGGTGLPRLRKMYLQVMGEWKKAVDIWREDAKRDPVNALNHAYLSAALKQAGDMEGAAREEAIAERLCLGDFSYQYACCDAFGYAGDFETASRWMRRAVSDCAPDSTIGFPLVGILQEDAMTRGDWKLAAAIAEVAAFDHAMQGPGAAAAFETMKFRVDADMCRGFSRLQSDPQNSLEALERVQNSEVGAASLADHFFPSLRAVGLLKQHDQWFEQSWQEAQPLITRYPDAANLFNSFGWAAARANRHLDEAEALEKRALELRPDEPDYVDTLSEISFARRDREQAVKWSHRANNLRLSLLPRLVLPNNISLLTDFRLKFALAQQYARFQKEDFPPP